MTQPQEIHTELTNVRDIRNDLKERVGLIDHMTVEEKASYDREAKSLLERHKARMDELRVSRNGLQRLLELEETRLLDSGAALMPAAQTKADLQPLADFFCAELAQRGVLSKEDLRLSAFNAGYFPTSEGGRATHATLVNLIRAGRVMPLKDNRFMARQREKAML